MKRLVIALFFLAIPYSIAHAALVEQDLVTQISGSTFSVAGKIDTVKHPTFKTFSIKGYLSNVADFKTVIKTDIPPTKAIGNDGTYGWTFTDLTPSTTYYFKQKVSDGKTTEESKVYNTTTTSAAGASAIPATQQDFDSRSYRLLAPFPGLSVLLDPDLCEEQRSQKGKGGEICDINDFLNYMFKLLVSLAAVLLVLRLVYEGYQYIVTDIPFLKASAKSGFFEALGGLALALSAYLILNTINPKLVENSISLNKVAVGIEEYRGSISDAQFTKITGKPSKTKQEYITLTKTLATKAGLDPCYLIASNTVESDWDAKNISCDENVTSLSSIKSRRIFVQSGIKFNGEKFTGSTALYGDKKVLNQCPRSSTDIYKDYDWRFSKGFGLSQVTVFPAPYNNETTYLAATKENGVLYPKRASPTTILLDPVENNDDLIKAGAKTVADAINIYYDPEKNIQMSVTRFQAAVKTCNGGTPAQIFNNFAGLGCSTSLRKDIAMKVWVYNQCKTGTIISSRDEAERRYK